MSEHKASGHKAEVVRVETHKHPNADSLSIATLFSGGYQCVLKTTDWEGIELAVYVPPDSVVDTNRTEFAFLAIGAKADGTHRVKAKKLRGVVSFGLMIPAPEGAQEGDDLFEALGIKHYEPLSDEKRKGGVSLGGTAEAGPIGLNTGSKYDLENLRRYPHIIQDDEPVRVMEKADGSNVRIVFWENRLWVGSRNEWKRRTPDCSHMTAESLINKGVEPERAAEYERKARKLETEVSGFWRVIERTPAIEAYCRAHPGRIVWGEIYGSTNRIKYGFPEGDRFGIFDLFEDGKFLDIHMVDAAVSLYGIPAVPTIISSMPYSFEAVSALAEGPTLAEGAKKDTIREGVVVRPLEERYAHRVGRVVLKAVSGAFLEKY